MPRPATPAKKQQLTLAQIASYDDILTDALVDHTFYWTNIPKNRTSYHPCRGLREDEIGKIIQDHLIVNPNLATAEERLLATDGLRKYQNSLRTPKEKDDFKAHLRRYMSIYLPDCPWEVNATNRYTIVTQEASVTARRFIKRNETVKYLSGIQVVITPEEEEEMALRKKDFSIVVSSRSKSASLFMGPARFANHDCDANARLVTRSQAGIEIIACKDIDVGDEITVTYGENYFGEDNCECLCKTCEDNLVNGWAPEDGNSEENSPVKTSIEEGYSLRRRRRDESACDGSSRTSSVAPDIRPRIRKSYVKQLLKGQDRGSTADATPSEGLEASASTKRKRRGADGMATPPATPAKKQKTQYEVVPISGSPSSRSSSVTESSSQPLSEESGSEAMLTDATTPPADSPPVTISPEPSPTKDSRGVMKQEEDEVSVHHVPELTAAGSPRRQKLLVPPVQPQQERSSLQPTVEAVPVSDIIVAPESHRKAAEADHAMSTSECGSGHGASRETVSCSPSSQSKAAEAMALPDTPSQRGRTRSRVDRSLLQDRKGKSAAGERGAQETPDEDNSRASSPQARQRQRVPGDYTLTPLLLSGSDTAWILCTNCSGAFVQQNAYYTRSNCPRCERHSKLYGYIWPKTEREGPRDEERILDHRTINRFLGSWDEAKARGRRHWKDQSVSTPEPSNMRNSKSRRSMPEGGTNLSRVGSHRSTVDDDDDDDDDDESASLGVRRSGRVRRASAKAGRVC